MYHRAVLLGPTSEHVGYSDVNHAHDTGCEWTPDYMLGHPERQRVR